MPLVIVPPADAVQQPPAGRFQPPPGVAMNVAPGRPANLEFFPEHLGGGLQTEWRIWGRRAGSSAEYVTAGTPLHEDDPICFEKIFTDASGQVTKYWLNTEGRNSSGGYLNVMPMSLLNRDGGATTWRLQRQTPGSFEVEHVFVLMLENRSFDHMLGFSSIRGTDAVSNRPTQINGLSHRETNSYTRNGQATSVAVATGAPMVMPADPNHEFENVVKQLCGERATYTPGGAYPAVNNSGFAADFATLGASADPAVLMLGYAKEEVPALYTLATEFAVCDAWFSSMPGPTWPNRFFAIAGSSGNLDDSPTNDLIAHWTGGEVATGLGWTAVAVMALNPLCWPALFLAAMTPVARRNFKQSSSFKFERGTLFDKLGTDANIYVGNRLNNIVGAVEGVSHTASNFRSFSQFASDLAGKPAKFTFIEPDYGTVPSIYKGNSQHPTDDMRPGDELIATVYNAIRGSKWWDKSLLIVTWDEHGGFYDHVAPPVAPPPGDQQVTPDVNIHGFKFDQYGVRVPAVIVSPWIPKGVVDHRVYDHASIPSTVEALFNLEPMTTRDRLANDLTSLLTLSAPRTGDQAPAHIVGAVSKPRIRGFTTAMVSSGARALQPKGTWQAALGAGGNGPGFFHSTLRARLDIIAPERLDMAHAEVERLKALPDTPANRETLISLLQELESEAPY